MKYTQFVLTLISILLLVNCGGGNGRENQVAPELKNYKTVVSDSLVFEWLAEVQLLDYNEETEELLLLDRSSKEILIVDKEGQLINRFNPHIEGPNYVGDYDFGWIFYGNDSLMCYGTYFFHLLDKDGNRIKRFPYPVETNGLWSLDYDPRMLFSYKEGSNEKFVAFITAPEGPSFKETGYNDSVKMVYAVDIENETGTPIMHKPETSVYRNLEGFVDHGWPYMSNYRGSRFAQVHAIDSMLYIWDAEGNQLLNSIVIPKESQPRYEVFPFGQNGTPDIYTKNASVYSTQEYIILHTLDIIPESVIRRLRNKYDRYRESEEYQEAVKKYRGSENLVFNEKEYLGKLKYETGLTGWSRLNTKKDFMWMIRRYKDERDYRTFLKVKIVADD